MTTRGRGTSPAPIGAMMTPSEWFQLLYPGAEAGWITISSKRDAATRQDRADPFATEWVHVSNLALAGQRAEALAADAHVYNGVGLRRERLTGDQRGTSQDVSALPGLWVEVDCAAGTHDSSAKAYFPDKVKAQAFLEGLPHRPTAVVDSGGGLHAYWLFRELWVLDADEQDHASALLRGWQGYIRAAAQVLGYAVDYTHDLARVLRPVGTWNRKNGTPLQVQPVWMDGPRYNQSDFDEWMDWTDTSVPAAPRGIVLRAGAQPPAGKFAALLTNDKKFADSWGEHRSDLKDQSASGYALALASIAAQAGWTSQELCDLLVAFREKRPRENTKGLGWYVRTIGKAQAGQIQQAAAARAIERVESATEPDEKLAALSQLLGFRVLKLVRFFVLDPSGATTDPSYMLHTDAGAVRFDMVDELLSRMAFRNRIAGHIQRIVDVGPKDWPAVSHALIGVAVTEDAPIETSEYEQVRQHIVEYLETRGACEDPIAAHDGHMVLSLDGQLWFGLSEFAEWCRIRKGAKVGFRNLPTLLSAIGSRKRIIEHLLRGGKRTRLVFWSAP